MLIRIKDFLSKNNYKSNNRGNKEIKFRGNENNYFESDYREKYYLALQKNLILEKENVELKQTITELKNEFNYNEYYFLIPRTDLNGIIFEKKLSSKGIKNYIRKMKELGRSINYYVHKDEWLKFIECVEEYNNKNDNDN